MGQSDSDILVPKSASVTINGKSYPVRPFSVKDVITFTRELITALSRIREKYPTLEFKQEEMLSYFPLLLDEVPTLINLLGRSINVEGQWLETQTDLAGVSQLFAKVTEVNDFGTIISNFRIGWSNLKKQTITASAGQ